MLFGIVLNHFLITGYEDFYIHKTVMVSDCTMGEETKI